MDYGVRSDLFRGGLAARKMSSALAKYAISDAQYLAWRTGDTQSPQIEARLSGVRFAAALLEVGINFSRYAPPQTGLLCALSIVS